MRRQKHRSANAIKSVRFGTRRTVVVDAVYEAHSHLGVIVGHQDDVKQLLALWIELPQPRVEVHQRLFFLTGETERQDVGPDVVLQD